MSFKDRGISPEPDFQVTVGINTFPLFYRDNPGRRGRRKIGPLYKREVRQAFLEHGGEMIPHMKPEERSLLLRDILHGIRVTRDPNTRGTFLQMTAITLEASEFTYDTVRDALAFGIHHPDTNRAYPANIRDLINVGMLMLPHLSRLPDVIDDMNQRYTALITSRITDPVPQQDLLGHLDEFIYAWRNPGTPITLRNSAELEGFTVPARIYEKLPQLSLPQLFDRLKNTHDPLKFRKIVSAIKAAGNKERTVLLDEYVRLVRRQGDEINPAELLKAIALGKELISYFPFEKDTHTRITEVFDPLIDEIIANEPGGYRIGQAYDIFRHDLSIE